MNRKVLLIQILERLQGYWPSAEAILLLIKEKDVDEELIDGVLHLMAETIRTTRSLVAKIKLQKSQKLLKKIKEQEQQYIDQQEAELLLAELDNDRS